MLAYYSYSVMLKCMYICELSNQFLMYYKLNLIYTTNLWQNSKQVLLCQIFDTPLLHFLHLLTIFRVKTQIMYWLLLSEIIHSHQFTQCKRRLI